ncbi:histidinol dehydrogenase [Caproiciproducens faecalis]|uniref:Histidinol dehydrogenase n=1 Tax=Caproiciproducens faecalis TaxID=2820301 RepID=A0ABS7DR13_9FIRM|nr:histidinol dehydrogenase [Caproiciproducens faecalis]MBW7573732.1 histidinol dehydrogenase [Caproiciproducens faecalis]
MIQLVKKGGSFGRDFIRQLKLRNEESNRQVETAVSEIIENVRLGGDTAVRDYTLKFDGALPDQTEISSGEMKGFLSQCEPDFLSALSRAAENIKDFHSRQKQQSWFNTDEDGVMMGQRIRGLSKVGIYVPGGTAAYPSSVLMNAIPAKIAGVQEIIMVTPPGKDGKPNPDIMAAALTAGVDRVFLVGGAQAVAALAFGTETIPKVDKIVGPGNIYVATAKKQLYGTVDIDMIAGPSEILIIADETAKPEFLAADLMSQAEHDVLASAILLTTSEEIAEQTVAQIDRQMPGLSRKEIIARSLDRFGAIVVCESMEEAVAFSNELAPEHLEVCAANPMEYIGKIDNAGSVFLGNYSPEPLGDYFAGPNHVLPTSGTARFFSPLSVDSFIKKSSFIYYTESALKSAQKDIIQLAETEGLTAHANSIKVRR